MDRTRFPASTLILSALVFFVFLFVFFIYTFLHEGGHAIAGLLFGQSLTEFNVSFWDFSAHVGMTGGELTQPQLAVRSAAGVLLPLLTWTLFISLLPRNSNFTLEALKLLSSMTVVNTLLVWIVLPILFIFGKAPMDDVTYFLRFSQIPPWLVSLAACILYIVGWRLFLAKTNGLRNAFKLFRGGDLIPFKAGMEATILVMAVIMGVCAFLAFSLSTSAGRNSGIRFSPPQDFVPVAEIDLSKRAVSAETITQFTLDEPAFAGVYIIVHNIDTTFFDLSVTGPEGYRSTVLHGEGYKADQDGGLWEDNLPAGTYHLLLTSHQSPGTVSIYSKTP